MALWATTGLALSTDEERLRIETEKNRHLRQKLASVRLELESIESVRQEKEHQLRLAEKKLKEKHDERRQKEWSKEADLSGQLAVLEAKKTSLLTTKDIVDQEYKDLDDIRTTNQKSLDAQIAHLQHTLKRMGIEKANMKSYLSDAKHRLKHSLRECEILLDTQQDLDTAIADSLSLARAFVTRKLATILQDDTILIELKELFQQRASSLSELTNMGSDTLKLSTSRPGRGSATKISKSSGITPKEGTKPKHSVSFTDSLCINSKVKVEDLVSKPIACPTTIPSNPDIVTEHLTMSGLIRNALQKDSDEYYRQLLNSDVAREFGLITNVSQPRATSPYMEKLLLPPAHKTTESTDSIDPADQQEKPSDLRPEASPKKPKRSTSLRKRVQQLKQNSKQYTEQLKLIDILIEQRKALQDKLLSITSGRNGPGAHAKISTIMLLQKKISEVSTEIEEMTHALPRL